MMSLNCIHFGIILASIAIASSQGHDSTPAQLQRRYILNETTTPSQRCISTQGDWCMGFHQQELITWKPAPRGNKSCPGDCNTVGNCNHDSGLCECPAGWKGKDCLTVQKRPCTNRQRSPDDKSPDPINHSDENGRDKNWLEEGSIHARCSGICDDEVASCWCPPELPKGHIPAPKGSPPGIPPVRIGRPLISTQHQPRETKDGKRTGWGDIPYDELFGPKGWCVADQPVRGIACIIDGLAGQYCDTVVEHFCINQCNGHGSCYLGFCKCDPGWYGHDCSRKKAGLPLEPSRISQQGWLKTTVVEALAAMEPPPKPTRKRPLIYVYDLEPLYSQKMLQYRIPASWCVHRKYEEGNNTVFIDYWVYAVDTLLHEMLLQSEHRTFDPDEADFFYVPQYSTCYIYPIKEWADFPWFATPGLDIRVAHASVMMLETKQWIEENFPYWKRRRGTDHIWLFTHDEGSCWVPTALLPSIWLTHWGRLGINHTSNTAFGPDNYDRDYKSHSMPNGWRKIMTGHACYDPAKDLVVPSFKAMTHYHQSPLSGVTPRVRDILLFFKGDVGRHRQPHYSRGVRQRLYKLSQDNDWKGKHNVLIGDSKHDFLGDYSELLSRSKYCLVAPGDGWSARAEDSVLHGCVPVIIMDGVHVVFETILNWSSFSIRIPEADIDKTVEILLAVPERKLRSLQAHLSRVWQRFRYMRGPSMAPAMRNRLSENIRQRDESRLKQIQEGKMQQLLPSSSSAEGAGALSGLDSLVGKTKVQLPRPFRGDPEIDDAFSSIIQWLYGRIKDTR